MMASPPAVAFPLQVDLKYDDMLCFRSRIQAYSPLPNPRMDFTQISTQQRTRVPW